MKLKFTIKPTFPLLFLLLFTVVSYGQQITRIDFGVNVQTTPGNWNNSTVQNVLGTATNLIDITGASTGEVLTLTDVFDRYERNNQGTQTPTGFPFLTTASRDSFFGENVTFDNGSGPSTEPTGGFTLSGLEIGRYYSFTIFASRMGVSDNRETLYTITGNAGTQTASLNAANNTSNVATIINVQPNGSGEISIQATTGPNNTNFYGFYYLGAIEMTKTNCLSTITWNGSAWSNGTGPDSTTKVILNGNYDTAINGGNFSACSLTVSPTATLTVGNGTYVEFENDVIVDGTINVQSQGNFVQNNDAGTFIVNTGGISRVIKQTPPKAKWYYYTYWSSPVEGETVEGAFPDVDGDRRFSYNASNYIDRGDGIDNNGDDWQYALAGDVLLPGVGYASTASRFHLGGSDIADFEGPFNTSDISTGIINNPVNVNGSWNFIGNPYPSALDFRAFYAANIGVIEGVAYFWSQATPPSSGNAGNQTFNFSSNDYAIYSFGLNAGVAGGDATNIPNQYIPSAQGFFIAGIGNANVTFTNAMRMADATSNTKFFKNSNSKNNASAFNDKLWINLTSDNGVFNQILVGYVAGATNGNDGLTYDALKLEGSENFASIYSTIEGSNNKFVIQGKDLNSINTEEVINLGFATAINVATLYKFSIAQLEGDFLSSNTIYLKDNLLNQLHNLSAGDYTFTSEIGEYNDRFEIVFNASALSTNDVLEAKNSLSIIELEDNRVQFNVSNNLKIKTISVYDLLGRELYNFKGQNSTETYRLSNLSSTVYIAKVALSNGAVITKKAIKK